MGENKKLKRSFVYGIVYLAIFGIGMASVPVQEWFEYAIRCTGENPLTPLNPAIVGGVLGTFFHASLTLWAIHFLIFNRTIPIEAKRFGGLCLLSMAYFVVSMYLIEHRSMKWNLSADAGTKSNNQLWCEHRPEKD